MPNEFDNAILEFTDKIKRTLEFLPSDIKQKCEEIRLRAELPVCLTVDGGVLFVSRDSSVSSSLPSNPLVVTKEDVTQCLSGLCNNSIYLHENEIKQGFISLKNGNRAGVCGVFNADGMLISVSSINVRIARQIFGCAGGLLPFVGGGLLLAGPPGSGKTTMLRDVVRLISNGTNGEYYRVAVVDSRREISGGGALDLGVNTDLLFTLDKAVGAQIALRTMFPHFIAFDEIGTTDELQSVRECFNAGVGVITTAHCNTKEELFSRDVTRQIIESGAIKNIVLLSKKLGEKPTILKDLELEKGVFN
ncbi:MAG: hypothetical protein IKT42_00770 [Clostridia bacterium]|nr:hypothetical protein [Clostridia bacterium]